MSQALKEASIAYASTLHTPLQDFESAAVWGLVKAAMRFDASRKVPFWAFAKHRVRGQMADMLSRDKTRHDSPRASERIENVDVSVVMTPSPTSSILLAAVESLPPRLQTIIKLRYFKDFSQAEVSTAIGLRSLGSRACVLEHKALDQLRAELALRGVRRLEDVL